MKYLFLIIVIAVAAVDIIKCDKHETLDCKDEKKVPVTRRLKDFLFCKYDSSVRPSKTVNDPTSVDIRMMPQYVEFSEEQNIVHLHTWLATTWTDTHLAWEPSKWEDVKEIHVKSYEIWKPDLTVFNTGDVTDDDMLMFSDCLVSSTGQVKCVAPVKYSSHCPTDYSEWPYDRHECTLQIGAWVFYANEIILKLETDAIMMHSFMPNKQWDIHIENGAPELMGQGYNEKEGELTIFIKVILQRHGSRLAMIYILPAFVLMALTMVVLWLDSQSLERIFVACVNFICHLLGMFDLHWYFPSSGSETSPKIITFYEISVGLSTTALILTCLLRKLRNTNVPAPMWLSSAIATILASPVGKVLRLNILEDRMEIGLLEDADTTDGSNIKEDRTWRKLALIIEWFSFAIVFFVYVISLAVILPPGEPKKFPRNFWLR